MTCAYCNRAPSRCTCREHAKPNDPGGICTDCLNDLDERIRIDQHGTCPGCGGWHGTPYRAGMMTDHEFREWYRTAPSHRKNAFWSGDRETSHAEIAEALDLRKAV